jgi:GH35 family endo-1,4-beta-xylanase
MDKSSALILLVITGLLLLFADFCHALGSRQKNSQLISKSSFGIFNDYVYNPDSPDKFDMQLAGELGNGSARLIMPWEKIEAAKGVFDFTLADQLLEAHTKNNITPVVTVLSRSRWATQKSSPEASALPVRWEDYENFISTVVSRYKGKVKYWQIENEIGDNPDIPSKFWAGSKEDYLELLKHAYKAIKRADPYARVVLQGFSNEMFKRIYEGNKEAENFFLFFMSECRDYFDVIDFHQY